MSPLRKVKKIKMPLNHQDTKLHKELIISNLVFMILCVLVSLRQKITFRSELKNMFFKIETVI